MARGYLKVNVYNDTIANPVKGATVIVSKDGQEFFRTTTNEDGQTEVISLDTVDKSYSGVEQYSVRPYETYDLLVEALGFNKTEVEGVQIFEEVTSIQDVYLSSIDNKEMNIYEKVTPNTLWGDYSPNIWKEEDEDEEQISPIVLKEIIIPETIVVHDGIPSNSSAPNYTVSFVDYIKNVASSEIYSTWPKETIKANILAMISFTLNRVYTEWYRSRGYDFTITSTTSYDQKYTRNGTIFEPISIIVDEIFRNYIRKGVRIEPLLAHYKNNTSENGYMSQWGSKELGDKGYSALQILRYYYGEDINIYEAEVEKNYPYSFTSTLSEGSCSINVYFLQNALNYIRGSYPGIPMIQNPSGYFDDSTLQAVKKFQSVFSLNQTGKVDYQTWYKISYVLTAVKNLTESVYN